MGNKAASGRAWVWPWRSSFDDDALRKARQDVAHLLPAVVITGGSKGIGQALAQRFLEAGHKTAIVARSAVRLEEAASELKAATGFEVATIICDVSEPNAFDVITAALDRAGLYLDVLVNCAGTGLAGPFVDHSQADISRLLTLNVETVTRLTRAALPLMLARRQGGVMNVASLAATVPGPNQAAYYASKAFVVSLTEAISSEMSGRGVRVAALLPGPVDTAFHAAMGADRSLYRFTLPSSSPAQVARSGYRGFMFGNRVIVPGISNMFFYVALRVLPHILTVPLLYWLLRRPDDLSGP
ncbi:MAG: SDR family oxidoreductase [Hyphomicrobium sp.]